MDQFKCFHYLIMAFANNNMVVNIGALVYVFLCPISFELSCFRNSSLVTRSC